MNDTSYDIYKHMYNYIPTIYLLDVCQYIGVNIPGESVLLPAMSDKDKQDIKYVTP